MKVFPLVLVAGAVSLAISAYVSATDRDNDLSSDIREVVSEDWRKPEPIQALEREGLTIHESFDVGGGVTGFAMSMQGQLVPVFLMPEGDRAIIGTMIDGTGNGLFQDRFEDAVIAPATEAAWELMESHRVVVEGADDAPHVLYTITDPNCPYCHRLWESALPLVEAGELQVRHVMVGTLSQDSVGKAAAILQSDDPAYAMHSHQAAFQEGGITPATEIDAGTQELLDAGREIMGIGMVTGTPASFYKDADGRIQRIGGAVPEEDLRERFGISK